MNFRSGRLFRAKARSGFTLGLILLGLGVATRSEVAIAATECKTVPVFIDLAKFGKPPLTENAVVHLNEPRRPIVIREYVRPPTTSNFTVRRDWDIRWVAQDKH
ncbi:MAG: hypothetical protein AB7G93_01765 [Bdellovibrionales bacterium]